MNSFGDRPWEPNSPLLVHNSELVRYLRANVEEFGLHPRIRFNTQVTWVTPVGLPGTNKWKVCSACKHPSGIGTVIAEDIFDGVMVCTGRHGGGGFIPDFPGLDQFRGFTCHSSQYKSPAKHDLADKTVVVVGIGNSGCDIVTELGPVARKTVLVARSGGYVARSGHMETMMAKLPLDRVAMSLHARLPWWLQDQEFLDDRGQSVLNKHGLTPTHRCVGPHIFSGTTFISLSLSRRRRGTNVMEGGGGSVG
jgi:dimethylaniline monooxygenase (N-oxide forming)